MVLYSVGNTALNVEVRQGYYVISLNATRTINGVKVVDRIALSQSTKGGMWKTCIQLPGELVW